MTTTRSFTGYFLPELGIGTVPNTGETFDIADATAVSINVQDNDGDDQIESSTNNTSPDADQTAFFEYNGASFLDGVPIFLESTFTFTIAGQTFTGYYFEVEGSSEDFIILPPNVPAGTATINSVNTNPGPVNVAALASGDEEINQNNHEGQDLSGGDTLDGGAGDDTIDAGAGDDSVFGGDGDDSLLGNAGDDTLIGGDGADTIRGDSGEDAFTTTRESFNWSEIPDPNGGDPIDNGDDISGGTTQDTGTIDVTMSYTALDRAEAFEFRNNVAQYIEGIDGGGETVSNNSVGYLQGESGGSPGDTASVTFDFASNTDGVEDEVRNVQFRINDVDDQNWRDILEIQAFNADGDPVTVTLTGGADMAITNTDGVVGGDTATAINNTGNGQPSSADNSLLIEVAGPVSQIVITYGNLETAGQRVDITDMFFDAVTITPNADFGDDSIEGGAGADSLVGDGGDDSIFGGADDDTIEGGDDDDLLDGGDGVDVISGGDGFDTIIGGAEADSLFGGAAADRFVLNAGFGDDVIVGGEDDLIAEPPPDSSLIDQPFIGDNDIIDMSSIVASPATVTFTGNEAGFVTDGVDTATFSEIEGFILSAGNDLVEAQVVTSDLTIDLGVGDDTLLSGAGSDLVFGGVGSDSILAADGDDIVFAGDGGDIVEGGLGGDFLYGEIGDDSIVGGDGSDFLFGGDGADSLFGGEGDDRVYAGAGDDVVIATPGQDTIFGGDGADNISVGEEEDVVYGGAGADTVDGGEGSDTLFGGNDDDSLLGGLGDDSIVGGDGADIIDGGAGADTIEGDGGVNLVTESFNWSQIPDPQNGGQIDDEDNISAGTSQDTGGVTVSMSWQDDGVGDRIEYQDGARQQISGIDGGGETVSDRSAGRIEGAVSGNGPGESSTTTFEFASNQADVLDEVVNVRFRINDIDEGNWRDQVIIRAFDADDNPIEVLLTGGSDLVLTDTDGVPGADTATAPDGSGGGFPRDISKSLLVEVPGPVARIEVDYNALEPNFQAIELTDIFFDTQVLNTAGAADQITGGDGDDSILGQLGDDTIEGGIGDDSIFGGDGADSIEAGDGSDSVLGDEGDDIIAAGDGDDTIDGGDGADSILGGDGFDDFLVSTGDDTIADFNLATGQDLRDGDQLNNDFVDLSPYYDDFFEARADLLDDGVLNQSNATDTRGETVDYTDNTSLPGTIALDGVAANDLTFDNTNLICFAAGTLIRTDKGDVPVQDLAVGDNVWTLDRGFVPLRWIGGRTVDAAKPGMKPVRIKAGALGGGSPTADLIVSPQHRILVRSNISIRMFSATEILVPAKKLVGVEGIDYADGFDEVTYYHFMFDAHEIVMADGTLTESLFTGPEALRAIDSGAYGEIIDLFPQLANPSYAPEPVRPIRFKGKRLAKLVERHISNNKPLFHHEDVE